MTDIFCEFYTNIREGGDDYFETWLRGKPIRVDANLINAITRTLRVPDSVYLWPVADRRLRSTVGDYFEEGCPNSVGFEGVRVTLNMLSLEAQLVYRLIANRVHLVKSVDPITFERPLCLYAMLTRMPIDVA